MQPAAALFDIRPDAPERPRAAVSVPLAAVPEPCRTGYGTVHAHHGEVMQGLFYAPEGTVEHGLVTLPCGLFGTRARFRPLRSGPLTVQPGDRGRARLAARLTLDALGRTGWGGSLCIEGNVPLRWGCGSSTTDVLCTIRAVADAFGAVLEPAIIARISVAAETASDSLMYGPERAVLFAQRRGSVLRDLGGPLPTVRVLGFNTEGGGVETLSLAPMAYSAWETEAFRVLLGLLLRAVRHQDPVLLGRVATGSTVITQRHRPKRHIPEVLRLARETGAAGVQVAHSGTVAGLIFDPAARGLRAGVERARAGLRTLGMGDGWEFSTDLSSHPERVS